MELNHQAIETPVRDASTVVLLRDTAAGLEVFLMKRSGLSDVLGGAYVFPGGKLDAADAMDDLPSRLDQSPQALHAALNEPALQHHNAAALYVAALREAFEESGVLFAEGANLEVTAKAADLLKAGQSFPAVLAQLGLRLQTQRIRHMVALDHAKARFSIKQAFRY